MLQSISHLKNYKEKKANKKKLKAPILIIQKLSGSECKPQRRIIHLPNLFSRKLHFFHLFTYLHIAFVQQASPDDYCLFVTIEKGNISYFE